MSRPISIREGANGAFQDDGESLETINQSGNGSDKISFSAYLRHILPLGD